MRLPVRLVLVLIRVIDRVIPSGFAARDLNASSGVIRFGLRGAAKEGDFEAEELHELQLGDAGLVGEVGVGVADVMEDAGDYAHRDHGGARGVLDDGGSFRGGGLGEHVEDCDC